MSIIPLLSNFSSILIHHFVDSIMTEISWRCMLIVTMLGAPFWSSHGFGLTVSSSSSRYLRLATSSTSNISLKGMRRVLRMDDEMARAGIKQDLTICDEYLNTRFDRLSQSGHDLTPMLSEDIQKAMIAHNIKGNFLIVSLRCSCSCKC